jgi:hypothetical protein
VSNSPDTTTAKYGIAWLERLVDVVVLISGA